MSESGPVLRIFEVRVKPNCGEKLTGKFQDNLC